MGDCAGIKCDWGGDECGGSGGGFGGCEERDVQHEIAGGEVGWGAWEVQEEVYIVRLERGQRGAQVRTPVRVAISIVALSADTLVEKYEPGAGVPELEVNHSLDTDLGDIVVI